MQARMDRRHHGDVDIKSARRLDLLRGARLGLRRAGIAVEKERPFREARQGRYRGFVRLIGGDDGKDRLGACTASAAVEAPSTSPPHSRLASRSALPNRRVGLDVIGANAGLEVPVGAPAGEKGLRGLAKAEKGDRARTYC